jgi:hypothetical protein
MNITIPEVPKLRFVRAVCCDLNTGTIGLAQQSSLFVGIGTHAADATANTPDATVQTLLRNVVRLRKRGLVSAMFDATFGDTALRQQIYAAIEAFFLEHTKQVGDTDEVDTSDEAAADKATNDTTTKSGASELDASEFWDKLLRVLEPMCASYAEKSGMDAALFADANGVIAWILSDAVYVLSFGMARATVIHNRLRAKNLKSVDAAGEYALDVARTAVKKKMQRRSSAAQSAVTPDTPKPLQSTLFQAKHFKLDVENNDRFIALTNPPWLQTQVNELFRVAGETTKRETACQMVWQMLRTMSSVADANTGSVAAGAGLMLVADVTPQEADLSNRGDKSNTPDQSSNLSNAGKATKATSGAAGAGAAARSSQALRGSRGLAGLKPSVAALVAVAIGVASYAGWQWNKKRKAQLAEQSQPTGYVITSKSSTAKKAQSPETGLPPHLQHSDSSSTLNAEPAIAQGETKLDIAGAFLSFDKMPRQSIAFVFATPLAKDSAGLAALMAKSLRVSIDAVPSAIDAQSASAEKSDRFTDRSADKSSSAAFDRLWAIRPDPMAAAGKDGKKTRFVIFSRSPVRAGKYVVSMTFSADSIMRRAQSQLLVLPSDLKSLSAATIPDTRRTIGNHTGFSARMLRELAGMISGSSSSASAANAASNLTSTLVSGELSAAFSKQIKDRLSVECRINDKTVGAIQPYSEPFDDGPCLPAWATKCVQELTWTSPVSRESIVLWTSKEFDALQAAPEVVAVNAFTQIEVDDAPLPKNKKLAFARPFSFKIRIKNLEIGYADVAVNSDPDNCRAIRATLDNIEPLGAPQIDFSHPETKLEVINEAGESDNSWKLTPQTLVPVIASDGGGTSSSASSSTKSASSQDGKEIKPYADGVYSMLLEVKKLPPKPANEKRVLRGKLAIVAGAKLTNPANGKVSMGKNTLTLSVDLEY